MAPTVSAVQRSGSYAGGRSSFGAAACSLSDIDAAKIECEACRPPQDVAVPVTQWSAHLLGEHVRGLGIEVSERTVSRVLHDADLKPHKQKMWLTSHDDEFREKRDDILHLYYDTPADKHIICLDEKTGMQALQRSRPDIAMSVGQPIRREFEYIRHGTLCLMGGYNVRARKLFGFVSEDHDTTTFVDLLELTDRCHPKGRGHIVCDNLAAHNTDDVLDWLQDHPRWTMHFTPKHASWLNQIECAFSIIGRHVLARGTFESLEDLRQRVHQYLIWFNQQSSPPFEWTYRPKSWRMAMPN